MKYKAALIDMDGVLYDSMKYHTLAWRKMISGLGIPCTREEFYLYEGMTGAATINLLFERHIGRQASTEEIKELYALKTRYFQEDGRKEKMPGADRMLETLRQRGLERVLVTGSGQGSILESVSADYPGAFEEDMRVTAHDVVNGKPHPEPYLKGAAKAGVTPEECIVIENAPLGIKAGTEAGCYTIGITTGPIPADELLKAGAKKVYPSMEAFADALPALLDELETA